MMAAFGNFESKTKKYYERRQHNNDVSQYRKLFRFFNEDNVEWIANHFLGVKTESRGGALSNISKMEIFLRTLSDPGFQLGVGTILGVHQTTVSKVVKEVAEKIVLKKDLWIRFPATAVEIQSAKAGWQIPGAIGSVDCTHFRIIRPSVHGEEYYNRKGFCSINVQATCKFNEWFTSVDASWPGSVHDSRIWRNSDIRNMITNNNYEALLLGDEGYGIAPWFLTPYKNPSSPAEKLYNKIHSKDRVIIERCFGQLKSRFPMLHYTLRLKLNRVCIYSTAGFVLHNVAKYIQDPNDFDPILNEDQPHRQPAYDENVANVRHLGQQ